MRHLITSAFFFAVLAMPVLAQDRPQNDTPAPYRSDGYLDWGAGFSSGALGAFGFGGEFLVKRGLGAGAELAVLAAGGDALGMASLNGVYHFVQSPYRRKGFVPFVTGGITSGSAGDGVSNSGGNIGGGMTWWFLERLGLRLEVRDYIFGGGSNCAALRLGISFR
jgi:hypothetical protein